MGLFDPQSIPGSPTSQQISSGSIQPWAQPYVFNYLNRAQNLVNNAQPTAYQQQVWNTSQNMQTPGQFAQGSDLASQAGQGMLGTTGTALGYGSQAAGAGQNYANMATNPSSIQAYMNPYIQQSLAPQLSLLNQQQALQGQNIAAGAASKGAFGGNRETLAQGLNAQNFDLARQSAIGQGYNQAFQQAQQAQQYGAGLGLQGLQTALQGVNAAQQGYTGANQSAAALGNIGAQQGQYGLGLLGLQNQLANQQYNLPFQNQQYMQGMLSGLPISSTTTQGYQAAPNVISQLAGVGTAGLGGYALYNALSSPTGLKKGGKVGSDLADIQLHNLVGKA